MSLVDLLSGLLDMKMKKICALVAAMSLCSLLPGIAMAVVITFDGLSGNNGDEFTTYTEDGYTVTKNAGSGCVAKAFGNPIPDVFGGPACDGGSFGEFSVTGTSLFSFDSIDFAANNGSLFYQIIGSLGGSDIWNITSALAGPSGVFSTITSPFSTAVDMLRLVLRTEGSSFNLDNIGVTAAVPEPGSLTLLGAGLLGLGLMRRNKR